MLKNHKSTKVGITIKKAAELLDVSVATMRNWDSKGVLKARRGTTNGYRYYDIGKLEHFAEKKNLRRGANTKVKFLP
ncbi:MAG: hypothetical protein COV10_01500 [Candidatus Vogelbacteria bacterium CG10_big_fil_rev_8_21_14_0_10_51_16]|uniref:HTH merR-type domain-containing protein n=1 Tax=Candidatus Vogelbacteria bacterium CG10_big_fil_rev_8_21_14_0_10_51_16 TaxID=1975045 RepID=A0A2H0RET8_9BACT|nr:MAG: hypothetical protein COV10_01500 [Candidatus Vogelbacteria bacterium CG10_big_fil_rev_8_21_14_0_10_51_16]